MKDRFEGPQNRERAVEALGRAPLFSRADPAMAEALEAATFLDVSPTDPALIEQGKFTSDIFVVLEGEFEVLVNSRSVARRRPFEHLGEMALIDPSAPRSATVRAVKPSTVLKLTEAAFTTIANKHPRIWRNVGDALAKRLRERGEVLREPNPEPRIFIGSSSEAMEVGRTVQNLLERDGVVRHWTDDVFKGGKTTIESLVREATNSDFAIFTVTPDDYLGMRERVYKAMRDNVLFELGMFLGALGRDRALAIMPRRSDIHLPTDLLGVTIWDYEPRKGDDLAPSLAPVANKIRAEIKRLGPR